jgi:hypothetical protein
MENVLLLFILTVHHDPMCATDTWAQIPPHPVVSLHTVAWAVLWTFYAGSIFFY